MTFTYGYAEKEALRMYFQVHGQPVPCRPPLLLIPGGGSILGTNCALVPPPAGQRQRRGATTAALGEFRPALLTFNVQRVDLQRL
jgi:hypothetical protein